MSQCVFQWIGGKQYMLDFLFPLIPQHQHYIEVFGGAASLLINKPQSYLETYNDIHSGLVNFFRVLQDREKFAKLRFMFEYTIYSREEYEKCKNWETELDDVKKAYKFFYLITNSFSGTLGGGWSYIVKKSRSMPAKKMHSKISQLKSFHERFKFVQIEHMDALKVLSKYDSPDSFFFVDPPYIPEKRYKDLYQHESDKEYHEKLLKKLLKARGKVLLCGYQSDLYDSYLVGWEKMYFNGVCHAQKKKSCHAEYREHRQEVIWMNYRKQQLTFW